MARVAVLGLSDGGVWAQMSTMGVRATERLAALAAERRPPSRLPCSTLRRPTD
jgi:3-hydroxyisobutyrate dehydrogenase-like beta-hydroxyacid dehydrogenase